MSNFIIFGLILEIEEAQIDAELEHLIARKHLMTELEDELTKKIGKANDTQKYVQHHKQSVEYIKKVHEKFTKNIDHLNNERAEIKSKTFGTNWEQRKCARFTKSIQG